MAIPGRAATILNTLAAAALMTVVSSACAGSVARDESGQVLEATVLDAFDLQVGDCFNDSGTEEVRNVEVVPCTNGHDFEVYHQFELDNGSFPGTDAIEQAWVEGCLAQFEPFVGVGFDESRLDISAVFPTEASWEQLDDRVILCSVTAVDGSRRSSSAAGSAF